MVFPKLSKSTKLGKKPYSKLDIGFVSLAAAKLEKQHGTVPLTVLQCLNGAGGKAVPTQNLGKHHLAYVWPLICEMRRKKEFKKRCVWFQHGGQSVLRSSKLLPWFWKKLMQFYSVFGAQLYSSRQVVLGWTHCTWVDMGQQVPPCVLQTWGCATRKGSRHHLMSPDQRLRQPDSPWVIPSAFHRQRPPASQEQHSLHTPLHTTTFKEQLDRFFLFLFFPPTFSWWEESVLPRDKTTGWQAGVGSSVNWNPPMFGVGISSYSIFQIITLIQPAAFSQLIQKNLLFSGCGKMKL